ncbi:hypothetical protein GWR56_05500 [Mucilaginibacter sp. 14171R-50]|uniref:hypothetical protein n=1 Tax=Mucilaginibacter sp. 14171R-50 TaxID=2703789 RepID=UPI00138D43B2|nr:hypothetical protein [Mucilaginibacter sp. 14171R-50]QHS55018.1 hypothetical protein GWR56_05500 [Mucilaginibacter sp. 14171R-50]
MEDLIGVLAIGMVGINFLYLGFNIYRQRIAEKKLEKLIKKHEADLLKMINDKNYKAQFYLSNKRSKEDFENLMMITFVNNQINHLSKYDKLMMKKIIERKSSENQQRYISKLFQDIGLSSLLHNSKKPSVA